MTQEFRKTMQEAFKELLDIQAGGKKPSKCRYELLNKNLLGGFRPGTICILGGTSGAGKTTLAQHIREDFLDVNLNPHAIYTTYHQFQWEMTPLNLLLRDLKSEFGFSMYSLLNNKFSPDEEERVAAYLQKSPKLKGYINSEALTPKQWYESCMKFLESQRDKYHVCIETDHIALGRGAKKKEVIDNMMEYANQLKLKYKNSSFIFLSQLNREIGKRSSDPRFAKPERGDLYASDTAFHIADLVLVIDSPYRRGLEKYMVVRTENKLMQPYLKYMHTPDAKYSSFKTEGLSFHHYLKIRQNDDIQNTQELGIVELFPWEDAPQDDGRITSAPRDDENPFA